MKCRPLMPSRPIRRSAAFLAIIVIGMLPSSSRAEDFAFFESKIRPLLVEQCYACHSSDQKQHGNLLLDSRDGTRKGGDSGPALVPGDPTKSLLLSAVKHLDGLEMPPKKKLTDEQINDLETWIRSGAADPRVGSTALSRIEQHLKAAQTHWSFQPIVDPKPAALDDLIGSTSAPEADRRTLLRRAYFDLVGVPPTFEEVSAFKADESPRRSSA